MPSKKQQLDAAIAKKYASGVPGQQTLEGIPATDAEIATAPIPEPPTDGDALAESFASGYERGFEEAQRAYADAASRCGNNSCSREMPDFSEAVVRYGRIFCRRFCAEFGA